MSKGTIDWHVEFRRRSKLSYSRKELQIVGCKTVNIISPSDVVFT